MEKMIKIFKALSCEWRIEILKRVNEKCICMCELDKEFDIDKTTISRHIKALKDAGLIVIERDGVRKNLKLKDNRILDIINLVEKISKG